MIGVWLLAALLQPQPGVEFDPEDVAGRRPLWVRPDPAFDPRLAIAERPARRCPLDDHRVRDLYATDDASAADHQIFLKMTMAMTRLERRRYSWKTARRASVMLLAQGERLRRAGHDPTAAGEQARLILEALHTRAPDHVDDDQVIAGIGHAALLRCDPDEARRWFALHAERAPAGRDRPRVLAVLAALASGAGDAAVAATRAAREGPAREAPDRPEPADAWTPPHVEATTGGDP